MKRFLYRVRFGKTGKLRFLSHLDLMRLIARAIRRSGLPMTFSEGFNPHPKISFPTALALGIESFDELILVQLDEWKSPAEFRRTLAAQLPAGMEVNSVEAVDPRDSTEVCGVEYEAAFTDGGAPGADKIAEFLARTSAVVERRRPNQTKNVDVRPYVLRLAVEGDKILMSLKVTPQGTAKPDEVLEVLGADVSLEGRRFAIRKSRTEMSVPRRPQPLKRFGRPGPRPRRQA
jgi:radical SAM-linked protein